MYYTKLKQYIDNVHGMLNYSAIVRKMNWRKCAFNANL